MRNLSLFCFGFGYTAAALVDQIAPQGARVAGTTTSTDKAAMMSAAGIVAHQWADSAFDSNCLDDVNAILISIPPGKDGCPAFEAARSFIADRRTQFSWIGYLSTNGVYGDHDGAWVDETSTLRATSERAKRRIKAETQWTNLAADIGLPVTIFRLPGIYGPGRSALDTVRNGKARRVLKKGQVFNRMHVEDIASVLAASISQPHRHNIYNLADDHPSPPQDVIEYACRLLNAPLPPLIPIDEAELSPMALSFYADNKRVSNKRMKEALGISLQFPTFRDGLNAIFEATIGDDPGTKR